MARTTAPTVGPKGDRCHDCNQKAEATATRGAITIRVCLHHTFRYISDPTIAVTADAAANVALCDGCRTFVGHAGRAAHRCN